jgi:signal transduction histidine kinase
MLGLLVVTRYLVPWSDRERKQIEQIGETITLACALERRYLWMERELNHQLELKEQQRDLLHDLLHQIRNPLTAIRTFGKLLVRRLLPEDPNREVSNHIIRESDRVEDLLRYLSRVIDQENEVLIENNSPNSPKLLPDSQIKEKSSLPLSLPMGNLVIEHIPLDGLLLPLIASATAIASDRQIKLVNKLPLNLPMVKGNRDGLREVFSNLLDNAIKYTPNQGKVTVQSIKKTGFQGIRITDNGLGIPAEDLDKLFTRGYRGKQALGDIPGTGLGLAIVKDLLTVMGGEIEIKSIVRSGTTIIVWLEIVP